MLNVIGGVYQERCMKPHWNSVYGSGGRAALAIAEMGTNVNLHSYVSNEFVKRYKFNTALLDNATVELFPLNTSEEITFNYAHGLDLFSPPRTSIKENIEITAENILIFGMLECSAKVCANYAVYDPQNTFSTESFSKYGSVAKHLALVLNESEARKLDNSNCNKSLISLINDLHIQENAEIIIIKRGPLGALVSYNATTHNIPAFETDSVWKIGSGDCFSAHFANNWIIHKDAPEIAAFKASKATAYYCNTSILPNTSMLEHYHPKPIALLTSEDAKKLTVYIASPFFTLAQLWMVEQIRQNLLEMGMSVISPYHDIGHIDVYSASEDDIRDVCEKDLSSIEKSDVIFGVVDGIDAGTIFEIGYANALGKKIVLLSENNSKNDLTMFQSKNIKIIDEYVTAIYKTSWTVI